MLIFDKYPRFYTRSLASWTYLISYDTIDCLFGGSHLKGCHMIIEVIFSVFRWILRLSILKFNTIFYINIIGTGMSCLQNFPGRFSARQSRHTMCYVARSVAMLSP